MAERGQAAAATVREQRSCAANWQSCAMEAKLSGGAVLRICGEEDVRGVGGSVRSGGGAVGGGLWTGGR